MADSILNYFSLPPASPMDAGFERQRGEVLRRRVRVYTGVMAAITLIKILVMLEENSRAFQLMAGVVEVGCLGVIFWRTRRATQWNPVTLSQLSMALVAGSGVLWLIAGRLDGVSVSTGMWTILWRHLLAAALLPWNWREAVFAVGMFALANAGLVLVDLVRGATGFWTLVFSVALAPAVAVPGVLLSWWRHSKFRARHQLTTESAMYRSLSREMEGARRVHEACMPAPINNGEVRLHYVYQPFRSLGGDLLYIHPAQPAAGEAFTLIVLDVAGHGIAAALTVNRIVGEVERMLAEHEMRRAGGGEGAAHEVTPAELARGLNRYVGLTLAQHGLFATAFIARVDARRERLTWVNCGHPSSFLRCPNRPLRKLEGDTMMLGVGSDDELCAVDQTEWFGAGSVLLACTDGATEARDPSGVALLTAGYERVLGEVIGAKSPPAEWPAEISAAVASHRQGPPDDDTLLVAVVRGGEAASKENNNVVELDTPESSSRRAQAG